MLKTPKLKSFLTVFPISETTWGLRAGNEQVWRVKLRNEVAMRAFCNLLPYLNGRHTVDELVAKLGEQGIDRTPVLEVLQYLEKSHLIEEADTNDLSPPEVERFRDQINFFSRFTSAGGSKYQALVRASRIGLLGDGSLSRSVGRQLVAAGFGEVVVLSPEPDAARWASDGGAVSDELRTRLEVHGLDRQDIWPDPASVLLPRLLIVPQEAHDPGLLEAVDAFSKRHGLPWLLLRAVEADEGWVGPLFVPGDTASYLSLDARLKGNLPFFAEHQAFDRAVRASAPPAPPAGGLLPFFDLLSAVAVTEVIKYVTEIRVPYLTGRFLTISLWDWEVEVHEVLRVPGIDRGGSAPRPAIFPWKELGRGDDL